MELLRKTYMGEREPGEIPKTFWLPDSKAQDQTLCEVCRRLDIQAIVTPEPSTVEYATLGLYIEIRRKAAWCGFCRLIVTAVIESWKPAINWDTCSDLEHTECGLDCNLSVLMYPIPPEAVEVQKRVNLDSTCYIDILAEDAGRIGMDRTSIFFGHSRIVPKNVADIDRMKEWLHICENYHVDTCGRFISSSIQNIPESLRVMDVEDMCLVSVAPESLPGSTKSLRYIALSYVWGNIGSIEQYKTTESNFHIRTTKGGLLNVPFPRTIQDAIIVTRRLGERYLWVDAACIIQDSPKDRGSQIGSMHVVYGAAVLTIVAVGGEDAESPLPRSHRDSPSPITQHITHIHGVRATLPIMRLYDVEHTLQRAPRWFTRGWTFQERQLSVRLLVFAPQQVYFQCRLVGYSEDKATEVHSADRTLIRPSRTACHDFGQVRKRDPAMYTYGNLVEQYTGRHLTYDADALDAFVGVGNMLANFYGERYALHYGLPGPCLEEALTWQSVEADVLIRRPEFPSWSWAGWRSRVTYRPTQRWMSLDGSRPVWEHIITEFHLHQDTEKPITLPGPEKRRKIDPEKHKTAPLRSFRNSAQTPYSLLHPMPREVNTTPPNSIPPGTLEFVTAVVPETAFELVQGDEHYSECICFDARSYWFNPAQYMWRIVDEGVTCGMMGNGVGVKSHGRSKRAYVCLARAGAPNGYRTCPGFDPRTYANYLGCALEVMLVEYRDDGIAERVGMGRIHQDAWVKKVAGLPWEKVWLR